MMFRNGNQPIIGLIATVFLTAGCSDEPPAVTATDRAASQQGHSGTLEGVVTDLSGQPLAGAFVKLKNAERRLTFMYVSQDEGRYTANMLPAGSYVVQGVGNDYESTWSVPIDVPEQGSVQMDLALTDGRAPDLPTAWPRRTPEHLATSSILPEGRGKEILMTHCTSCHTIAGVISRHVGRETWESTITEMRDEMIGNDIPDLADEDAVVLLDYLTANLPPMAAPNPNSRLPRTLMQDEARNYRVVQYDLENTGAENHDVAVDPWGVGWANQRAGGKISRFDPLTYEHSEVGPPLYTAQRARPGNPQISSDGIMWLPDTFENRWLSYDIAADKWTDWPFPSDTIRGNVAGNSMALHPDGTIWSAGPGAARRLDPATGKWSAWDTPTWIASGRNPGGYGITVAGDGRVWMAENSADRLARFDGETGEVVEFEIPVEGTVFPRRMDHDPEGNVWVGLWASGKILRVDYKTDEMTIIDPPIPYNGAYSIDFDETDNLLWVTLHTADIIARYNPRTEEWLMLPLPQAETDVRRIEVDQNNPNRIWWSSVAFNARIGFVELLDSE